MRLAFLLLSFFIAFLLAPRLLLIRELLGLFCFGLLAVGVVAPLVEVIVVVVVVVRLLLVLVVGRRRRRLGLDRGRAVGVTGRRLVVVRVVRALAPAPDQRARPVEVAAGVAERLAGVLLAQALELGHEDVARARRFGLGHGC